MIALATRLGRLLVWRRVRMYAILLLALYIVAWGDVLALGHWPLNSAGAPLAGDYIAFHAAGRLVLTGDAADLYSHSAIAGVQDELLGGAIPHFYDAYRNPPFYALIFAPLALLDLIPGFVVWFAISLGCLALALKLLLDELPALRPRWRGITLLVLAFPPVYFGLIDGENAMLSLLLYALIYRAFVRGQQCRLGLWAAFGLFKPQLFFLFPLIFVVTRRWRALLVYVATAVVLALVSFALVGADGLQAWVRILLEPEGGNATVNGWRMASAKSFWDALLPGFSTASLILYGLTSLALLGALIRVWTRSFVELPSAWLFTCVAAVLMDPHLVDYDLTVLVAAAMTAAPLVPKLLWAILPLYLVTLLRAQIPLGELASLQLPQLLLFACVIALWRRSLRASAVMGPDFSRVGAVSTPGSELESRALHALDY